MWKLTFLVCTVIVASVTSAPSLSSEENEREFESSSKIDQLIIRFRTQFMNDLEDFSELVDKVEEAEFVYTSQLEAQISRAVTQARHEVEEIFERIPPLDAVVNCKKIADALVPFASDTLNNITNCIANKIPSDDRPSVFDFVAYATEKLFAMKDEMNSCGGTFGLDKPGYEEYSDEDYEEYDVGNLEVLPASEKFNCTEVTAKVSEVLQEVTDSLANLYQASYDNISKIEGFANECESKKDYFNESKAIVESVEKCTQLALIEASQLG